MFERGLGSIDFGWELVGDLRHWCVVFLSIVCGGFGDIISSGRVIYIF